jgi:hypothetical protein
MAQAHMPYVLPGMFDVGEGKSVTMEAAFTEDAFRPDIGMKDAPFELTGPDGKTAPLATPTLLTGMTVGEASLPVDGLYRLSSGQRFGRMGKMYRDGEVWKMAGEGSEPPAGVTLVDVQSTTLADAYVLRGKPGAAGALAPRGKALEIHPLGDPSALTAGAPFALEILYQGKGLAGAQVTLFREAGFYDGKKVVAEQASDAAGKLSVTPPDAGRYLLLVRHRDAAPAAAGAPYYSYTVTLVFEVM